MGRETSNAAKVRLFMRQLGEQATSPGRVYLVGGASAVLLGWRETTIDLDLKLDPEQAASSRPSPVPRTNST